MIFGLSSLMYPTTLRRIYDNEFLVSADEDALTLPELLDSISSAIWSELENEPGKKYTARKPMISSLRQNLQRQHLELLIILTGSDSFNASAYKPISNLVIEKLYNLKQGKIDRVLMTYEEDLDPYTKAHLKNASIQIQKALEAHYIYRNL